MIYVDSRLKHLNSVLNFCTHTIQNMEKVITEKKNISRNNVDGNTIENMEKDKNNNKKTHAKLHFLSGSTKICISPLLAAMLWNKNWEMLFLSVMDVSLPERAFLVKHFYQNKRNAIAFQKFHRLQN